jgi:two-component system sensor histidine kinase UhpB
MKILLIDDSKEDRDLVINYLKKIENDIKLEKIDECNCLEDGLKKLSEFNYDAVILDLSLPEMDGIETVQTTIDHLDKHNKNTPVIVLTGLEDYSVGRKAWMLGIKEYLIKDEVESKDLSRALTFATLNSSNRSIAI